MPNINLSHNPVFVLGAGFSKCAGLPLQADFSNKLLSDKYESDIDQEITKTIELFLNDVFGWKPENELPSLEDIFTTIDLSASTGHNLGAKYKPNKLRALRRMLIYRIFEVIDSKYKTSEDINRLLRYYAQSNCSFVVLNWDIVLEKHLQLLFPKWNIDYATDILNWETDNSERCGKVLSIFKMHGSANWAYCENCKSLFYKIDEKLSLHSKLGLLESDFRLFNSRLNKNIKNEIGITGTDRKCLMCDCDLSSHIATFSYRKSFRTNAYSSIWSRAEKNLSRSDHWIFIGYSLPEADFEIKHLLKAAELQTHQINNGRKIDVVILNDDYTKGKYEKYFGKDRINVFNNGLIEYVNKLEKIE